jgi:hypothetical protein
MPQLPEIRIRYSRLMAANISPILLAHYRGPEAKLESFEFYKKKIQDYTEAWQSKEQRILSGLIKVLDVNFYLPVIDATIAPMVAAFSTPLTLNFKPKPDEFIDILTHELIHILISDNKENISFYASVQSRWPDEESKVIAHIMVHALMEYVFRDVLDEVSRIERDIIACSSNPPYAKAWKIVEEYGYRQVIKLMLRDKGPN